jgi:hypothetical protein
MNCIIFWGPFCWKCMRELNRIYMHRVLTGVQVLVTRTPEHAFYLGFTYFDGTDRDCGRNIIFRCSFIGYFFLGFILWQQGTCFYVWLWCKGKEHQNL